MSMYPEATERRETESRSPGLNCPRNGKQDCTNQPHRQSPLNSMSCTMLFFVPELARLEILKLKTRTANSERACRAKHLG